MIAFVTKIERDGTLSELMKLGIVSTAFLMHYEIYLEVDKQKKTTTKTVTSIVNDVADMFEVSENTIYKVMRQFKH